MAFTGVSRTIANVIPGEGSTTSSFTVSTEDWVKVLSEVDEFYTKTMLASLPIRKCNALDVKNNEPVRPMKLQTKENRDLVTKLTAKARGLVYIQHSIIYLLYVPSILETSSGLLSIKLFNTNTGESIDVDTDAPAEEAAIFVARWPRSIHADDGDGIHLLVNATSTSCKNYAKVGTIYTMWEDKLSKKKLYEKQYPSLRFPVEKSEAQSAVDDVKILQSMARARMEATCKKNIDIAPELIQLKGMEGKKATTVTVGRLPAVPIKYGTSETSEASIKDGRIAMPIEKVVVNDGVTTSS